MTAISKALVDIKMQIPLEILKIGFQGEIDAFNQRNLITSLDDRIITNVIKKRVMVEANLLGGVTTVIPLSGCEIIQTRMNEFVINVPKSKTSGKSIISVLSLIANLTHTSATLAPLGSVNTSPILTATANMYNSMKTINVIQTSRLELIGDNTIIVEEPSVSIFATSLRCNLEYDDNMTISPRFMLAFSKACVLATKSWLYTNLIVKLDQARLYGGAELSVITDIVNNYSDAEEQYQEFLTTQLQKILFMSDNRKISRFIAAQLGNTI